MPRRAPTYAPVEPRPRDLPPADLAAKGGMTRKDAAKFLAVGMTTLRGLIRSGELPSVLIRSIRVVSRAGAEAYLAQLHKEQASRK